MAARRQARAEAREIRMKELERQQKEQEQNADRVFDMQSEQGIAPRPRYTISPAVNSVAVRNNVISRRSSEDSVEADEGRNHRDIRYELKVRRKESIMKRNSLESLRRISRTGSGKP